MSAQPPPWQMPPTSACSTPLASSTAQPSATDSRQEYAAAAVGPVGAAVATRVEDDDPEVAREVRDLRLPEPGVRDRRGREEQEGRRRVAVDLVEDPHAVALDVALRIRVAGARVIARVGATVTATPGQRARNSRSKRFTLTGSRAWGKCPEPSSVTNFTPVASASATPCAYGWIASSSPCMTSTGQRTRAQIGELASSSPPDPRVVVCERLGVVSSPHPMRPRSASSSAAR